MRFLDVCFCDDEMMSKGHRTTREREKKRQTKKRKKKQKGNASRQPKKRAHEQTTDERRTVFKEVTTFLHFFPALCKNVVWEKQESLGELFVGRKQLNTHNNNNTRARGI